MSLPETCPFCGAGVFDNFCGQNGWKETWVAYECHTWVFADHDRANNQSNLCIARERTRLAARVAELEARCKRLEEAGDAMAKWNLNERNLGCDPELADAWQQAKEAKP